MGGAYNTLPTDLAYQEEVVSVSGNNIRIYNRTWHWVGEPAGVLAVKEALADSLIHETD